MKAVIQRVTRGKVTIEGKVHGEIGRGFVVLLGVAKDDTKEEMDYVVEQLTAILERLRSMSPLYEDFMKTQK